MFKEIFSIVYMNLKFCYISLTWFHFEISVFRHAIVDARKNVGRVFFVKIIIKSNAAFCFDLHTFVKIIFITKTI